MADVTPLPKDHRIRLRTFLPPPPAPRQPYRPPPERSRDDVMDTIAYSIALDPDFVMFNVLTPFPGTTLYDEGERDGVLDLGAWMDFMRNPKEDFKAQVWDEYFTRAELREMLNHAYRRFYWRPKFVARNLAQIRSPQDFMRKATAGVRMLTG